MISRLWRSLREWLAIRRLRVEVTRWKARNYDLCAETVQGLRRALDTQQRAQDDLRRQLAARDEQIERLRAEYAALEARLHRAEAESAQTGRLALFRDLQPVLVQLPTMRAAVAQGADLTARDVLDMLAPLDQLIADLGFECIGEAGGETSYDPRLHRVVGRGADEVAAGDRVRVRYVGYRLGGEIVAKAEVTRV